MIKRDALRSNISHLWIWVTSGSAHIAKRLRGIGATAIMPRRHTVIGLWVLRTYRVSYSRER